MCVCVYACKWLIVEDREQLDHLYTWLSPTRWVPGFKLGSLGLAPGALCLMTCLASPLMCTSSCQCLAALLSKLSPFKSLSFYECECFAYM